MICSDDLTCCAHIKGPIFWKLPGLGMSNMNFLIAGVIYFVSGTFSKGGAAKIKSKQFSEFGSLSNWGILFETSYRIKFVSAPQCTLQLLVSDIYL